MAVCDCGKRIVFGVMRDPDGKTKKIPLDPSAPIYRLKDEAANLEDDGDLEVERVDPRTHAVNHFTTCKLAGKFSRRRG
jgi:hypothetical protein